MLLSGTVLLCKLTRIIAGVKIRLGRAAFARRLSSLYVLVAFPKCEKVAVLKLFKMGTTLSADDSILAANFAKLKTFNDVAILLEVTTRKLGFYLHRSNNYKVFTLKKRSGGQRVVSSPVTPIRIIQRKLNQVLHAVYGTRSPVHGFVRRKSIVTNASRHLHCRMLLNFDLEDFFPTVHFGRVKGLFEGKPYLLPEPVAITLAQICCYNQILPVGAPTSPIVANMVCAQMDSQLKRLAVDCGCIYTRYADDITFSIAHGRFPPPVVYRDPTTQKWVIADEVQKIVMSNGFKINSSKTRVLPRGYRQEVTGLVIGDRVNVKRTYVRQVRGMLHACERWGIAAADKHFRSKYDRKQRLGGKKADFLRVLRGKIEFVGSVRGRDDVIYLRLIDRYLKLDMQARMRTVTVSARTSDEVIQRAIWLLEEIGGPTQGTGFAAQGLDILTAAHVLKPQMHASCPALSIGGQTLNQIRSDDHVDVGRASIGGGVQVQLSLGDSKNLRVGDAVKVFGFPLHRAGSSVNIQQGRITALSTWHGVTHFVIDCPIVRGNSGGPVLNSQNQVVGIAVKGQGLPKRFADDDELSRCVPIDFAMNYL
jgi:RNA-directed DNA polymerase